MRSIILMGRIMLKLTKPVVKKWLRNIHRDLGFLMVGICFVYAISGILLNHMNGKDPAYKSIEASFEVGKNLSGEELTTIWMSKGDLPTLKKVMKENEVNYNLMLDGGIGVYDSQTGIIKYEHHSKRELIYWINKLHYNKINGWSFMADFFAVSLIFFAVSGLFITSKKYGVAGRGKWFLIVGLLIPVLFIIFN